MDWPNRAEGLPMSNSGGYIVNESARHYVDRLTLPTTTGRVAPKCQTLHLESKV